MLNHPVEGDRRDMDTDRHATGWRIRDLPIRPEMLT
jgi:hypothetical protein